MSMSGIAISPEVSTLYNEVKIRKTHKYVTFKITKNGKEVVVDVKGDACTTDSREDDARCFEKLAEGLDKSEPRYILYDFGFALKNGRQLSKLGFIFWCHDESPIGLKMKYASTKDSVKRALPGMSLEFQANDKSDLCYESIADEVEKKA